MASVPSKRTNKLCTHAHHSDRSAAAAIFANGTYFVDTPRIIYKFVDDYRQQSNIKTVNYLVLI
jgi:hypothetical protein